MNATAEDLTVAWNSVSDSRVAGYEVNYGEASRDYSNATQSTTNSATVSGLEAGKTYYFAVKAFNADRSLESDFSNEVSTTIPYPAPEAGFTMSTNAGVAPLTVAFNDTSTGKVDAWQWSFDNGATSSQASPSYTFTVPGTYTVSLMVSGPGGAAAQPAQAVIRVATPPPIAAFAVNADSGHAPFNVQFSDQSSGTIDSWQWDFGDGTTSTERSPSHLYLTAGSYVAKLRVTGPGGVSAQAAQSSITVTIAPPSAAFTANATSGVAPMVVVFNDASSGDVSACEWNFGDGGTSTGASAAWTYRNPGTYSVVLKVTGAGGSDTVTKTNLITVDGPAPVADFAAAGRTGNGPLSVSFQDLSTNEITDVRWDFGDGSSSTERAPTHVYEEAGTYDVSLTVTGPYGTDTESKIAFVEVTPEDNAMPIEVGEVSVNQDWQWVAFERSFTDPVVVANPASLNGGQAATVRISGVDANGFWIRVQEWDYLDGRHAFETVTYVAMEKGAHTLPNGERIEVGTFTHRGRWDKIIGFGEAFPTAPVVFAAVTSADDPTAVTTRVREVTAVGFRVRMNEQESLTDGHGTETISYIAWQPSEGTLEGLQFAVGVTGSSFTDQPSTLSFAAAGFTETPAFLAHMQTMNSRDTAVLRYRNLDASGVELLAQEEQSYDEETVHEAESVGWAIFQNVDETPRILEVGELSVNHEWQWVTFGRAFTDPIVVANPASTNDAEAATVRISGVEANGFWIRIQEWDYLDGKHAFETVTYVAMEKGTHELPSGERIEAGTIMQSASTTAIGFAETFPTTPVVFATVASIDDTRAVTTRISNVNGDGFSMRMDQQENDKAGHGSETITYIAWQPSQGSLDGVQFAIGVTGNSFRDQPSTLSFAAGFTETPVFLAHMQTANGGDTAALRYRNLTSTDVEVQVQEEQSRDAETAHAAESVGWAIFQ
ncbi:PKD domain-containing protein [Thiocapsa marina]|nr:PKD domain-containing protein [Thiocapsa marina]